MVYVNKFVVAVKHRGKVLRDSNGIVRLPFGADYSLMLKNKNSVKALVDVEVDGKDVLDGNSLIIGPNEHTNLKGFMSGRKVRNRFRFIKKTKQISKYRGDRVDDGLIRVSFRFEQPVFVDSIIFTRYKEYGDYTGDSFGTSDYSSGTFISSNNFCTYTTGGNNVAESKSSDGITVPGAKTNQDFVIGNIGTLEPNSHVIILQLKGLTGKGKKVKKPITIKTKLVCPTCGKHSKSSAKFCSRCGTYIR